MPISVLHSPPRFRVVCWLTTAHWLTAACGGDASGGSATVERDSAGVTIVGNGPVSGSALFATVDPLPAVEIGRIDGPLEYQLFRVVSAHRLRDGRLVIANAGSHELRFYGADGRHLVSAGAEGEAPASSAGSPARGSAVIRSSPSIRATARSRSSASMGRSREPTRSEPTPSSASPTTCSPTLRCWSKPAGRSSQARRRGGWIGRA